MSLSMIVPISADLCIPFACDIGVLDPLRAGVGPARQQLVQFPELKQ